MFFIMRRDLYKYENVWYVIHRSIPSHSIDSKYELLKLWKEYLIDCGYPIDKIFKLPKTNRFLFCETIAEAEVIK